MNTSRVLDFWYSCQVIHLGQDRVYNEWIWARAQTTGPKAKAPMQLECKQVSRAWLHGSMDARKALLVIELKWYCIFHMPALYRTVLCARVMQRSQSRSIVSNTKQHERLWNRCLPQTADFLKTQVILLSWLGLPFLGLVRVRGSGFWYWGR